MEKCKRRSKSVIRQEPSDLALPHLLKLLNPLTKELIELEDMKRLLQKVPLSSRSLVQQIFHAYIFNTKSFSLPVSEFCRLFNSSTGQLKRPEEEKSPEIYKTRSAFSDVKPQHCKSISPERQLKSSTYVQLYQEKKTILRKKIQRRNTHNFESRPSVDSSPHLNKEGYVAPRSFKDCYPNVQELIHIRKAHFNQTNAIIKDNTP